MTSRILTIDREIEDVRAQVSRELNTIRDLMNNLGYRSNAPGWNTPFQIHRLRRALRIHYLALKIRDSSHTGTFVDDMVWELDSDIADF